MDVSPAVDVLQEEIPIPVLWKCTATCSPGKTCNNCGKKKLQIKWVDCAKSHAVKNGCDPVALADANGLCADTYGTGSQALTAQCSLVRPITQCTLPGGGGSGDPHMWTFDGLRYEFQGWGEFVYATDHETYAIHMRAERWSNTQTTIQSAIGVKVGDTKVSIYARETPTLRINDQPTVFDCPNQPIPNGKLCSGRIFFDNGGSVQYNAATGLFKVYLLDDVSHVDVSVRGGYINSEFFAGPLVQARTVGLLGTPNGLRGDDLATRDGRMIPQPMTFQTTYNQFAATWTVNDSESLFTYASGKSRLSFTDSQFPKQMQLATDLPQDVRDLATAQCKAAGVALDRMEECILDAALLGADAAADYTHIGGTRY